MCCVALFFWIVVCLFFFCVCAWVGRGLFVLWFVSLVRGCLLWAVVGLLLFVVCVFGSVVVSVVSVVCFVVRCVWLFGLLLSGVRLFLVCCCLVCVCCGWLAACAMCC